MASIRSKTFCVICKQNNGQFKCEGCEKRFCAEHVVEHRQKANQQLEEIISEHNTFQETIKENKRQYQSLVDYIEQWERTSIETIRQIANETRLKLDQLANIDRSQTVSKTLKQLKQQMREIQQNDGCFEIDLKNCRTSIEKVKDDYLKNVSVPNHIMENKAMPLIYQIQIVPKFMKPIVTTESNGTDENTYYQIESNTNISDERFDCCHGNARIVENGQFVSNGTASFFGTEIRGKMTYFTGRHELRFQIENNPSKIWIFIGIISQRSSMGGNLFVDSSVYGWGDYHDYFLAGHRQNPNSDVLYTHTFEHDVIKLTIDCEKEAIQYMNERSRKTEELSIDLNKCPFPWQLYLSLGGQNDQIRLLSTLHISSDSTLF